MALDSSLAVALQVTQHLTRKASYWGPLTETGTSVGGADRQEDWGFSFEHFRFAMSRGSGIWSSEVRQEKEPGIGVTFVCKATRLEIPRGLRLNSEEVSKPCLLGGRFFCKRREGRLTAILQGGWNQW